jgi:hypothetical protein
MVRGPTDNIATLTGPCTSCGTTVESPIPIHLDPTMDAVLSAWPDRQHPPFTCPHCRRLWPINSIVCLYWHSEWIGVALGQQFYAEVILSHLSSWFQHFHDDVASGPRTIRVFDSMFELSYVIRHPECSLFRVDLRGRITRVWDEESLALVELADAALQRNAPGLAYVILAGVVQENAEFFFIPSIRDALELTAHAAGDAPLGNDANQSALDDYDSMVAALHPHRPSPELDDYTIWHDVPLDINTEQPLLNQAGNHVVQNPPPLFDQYKIWLRILTAGAMVRGLPTSVERQFAPQQPKEGLTHARATANWERLESHERRDLDRYFRGISGISLQDALGLKP